MSLTRDLKTNGSLVRAFFESIFPDLAEARADLRRQVAGTGTLVPGGWDGYPWGTVGTALDYRLRFFFPAAAELPERWTTWATGPGVPFSAVSEPHLPPPLIAERGASRQVSIYADHTWQRCAGVFFGQLGSFLARARPHQLGLSTADEERLSRFCFVLALYEEFYRSPGAWSGSPLIDLGASGGGVDDLLGLCPDEAVEDLIGLSALFVANHSVLLSRPTVLNPVFSGSPLIGGADGDLIVAGCCLDIKAAADPKKPSPVQWPWELMGYVLLDHDDVFEMTSVGLYMARQGALVSWTLEEFMALLGGPGSSLPSLQRARDGLHGLLVSMDTVRRKRKDQLADVSPETKSRVQQAVGVLRSAARA